MTNNSSPHTWTILSSGYALDDKWFRVRKDMIQLPSGRVLDDYFVWESPDVSVIVPLTVEGKFILCEQYKHGLGRVTYLFPSGAVDQNETPEQAAHRELEEETGYVCNEVEYLTSVSGNVAKVVGLYHLYVSRNVQPGGQMRDDDTEETRILFKTADELRQLIDDRKIIAASSLVAALMVLQRLAEESLA